MEPSCLAEQVARSRLDPVLCEAHLLLLGQVERALQIVLCRLAGQIGHARLGPHAEAHFGLHLGESGHVALVDFLYRREGDLTPSLQVGRRVDLTAVRVHGVLQNAVVIDACLLGLPWWLRGLRSRELDRGVAGGGVHGDPLLVLHSAAVGHLEDQVCVDGLLLAGLARRLVVRYLARLRDSLRKE